MKGCSFQLINSFFPLMYVAFIKPSVRKLYGIEAEGCQLNEKGEPDCLAELQSQLAILVITRLIVNNLMALINPYLFPAIMSGLRYVFCMRCGCILGNNLGDAHPDESSADREARRSDYDTYNEMMEQLILFGYASLFVSAFPLAPLICMLSNYIEIRVDAVTFLHYSARPLPSGAAGIGVWGRFVALISFASCATNLGVTIFTNPEPLFGESDTGTRTAAFVVAEHVLLLAVFVIGVWIGDIP